MNRPLLLLLLAGCGDPLANDAPLLVRLNGRPHVTGSLSGTAGYELDVTGKDRVELELEVRDAEGHDVRVWFPDAPPGLTFDPESLRGTWDLGALQAPVIEFLIVLEDLPPDPAESETSDWIVHVSGLPLGDTGGG